LGATRFGAQKLNTDNNISMVADSRAAPTTTAPPTTAAP
jgi:hypothetical protein